MTHTVIPDDELKVFESLKNVKVVFDVGARDDVDYLILKPGIELHAFEPNPLFFGELKSSVGKTKKVHLNNFGLGDIDGDFEYGGYGGESIGKQVEHPTETSVKIKRLDDYVKDHNIKKIDFLKIDTEGYEAKVLAGGKETIKKCRYIQYEQGNHGSKDGFERFLPEDEFTLYYIGYRNVLGVRVGEEMPWIPEEPKEGGTTGKGEANKLK